MNHNIAAKIASLFSVLSPITTVILVVMVCAIITYKKKRARLVHHINRIPGPFMLPIIGNGLHVTLGCKDGE